MQSLIVKHETQIDVEIKCVWCEYRYLAVTVISDKNHTTLNIDNHQCDEEVKENGETIEV